MTAVPATVPTAVPGPRRYRLAGRAKATAGTALAVVVAAYVLAPIYWLVNSAVYALVTALAATAISTLCGYALAKYEFKGRRLVTGLVVASFLVPATALVVPLFLLEHDLGLVNSYEGLILPLVVYPLGVYFMLLFSADAVPDALLDAARVDGAGELRTFWRVSRPVLMPGMFPFLQKYIARGLTFGAVVG